jgi:hypothetical protein
MRWWWESQPSVEQPRETSGLRDRLRSVYERRFRSREGPQVTDGRGRLLPGVTMIVEQGAGRLVGFQTPDGRFVAAKSCCDDPSQCRRTECWIPLVGDPVASRDADDGPLFFR